MKITDRQAEAFASDLFNKERKHPQPEPSRAFTKEDAERLGKVGVLTVAKVEK